MDCHSDPEDFIDERIASFCTIMTDGTYSFNFRVIYNYLEDRSEELIQTGKWGFKIYNLINYFPVHTTGDYGRLVTVVQRNPYASPSEGALNEKVLVLVYDLTQPFEEVYPYQVLKGSDFGMNEFDAFRFTPVIDLVEGDEEQKTPSYYRLTLNTGLHPRDDKVNSLSSWAINQPVFLVEDSLKISPQNDLLKLKTLDGQTKEYKLRDLVINLNDPAGKPNSRWNPNILKGGSVYSEDQITIDILTAYGDVGIQSFEPTEDSNKLGVKTNKPWDAGKVATHDLANDPSTT